MLASPEPWAGASAAELLLDAEMPAQSGSLSLLRLATSGLAGSLGWHPELAGDVEMAWVEAFALVAPLATVSSAVRSQVRLGERSVLLEVEATDRGQDEVEAALGPQVAGGWNPVGSVGDALIRSLVRWVGYKEDAVARARQVSLVIDVLGGTV